MSLGGRSERVGFLREAIARIETGTAGEWAGRSIRPSLLPLGLEPGSLPAKGAACSIDRALGGGLASGTVLGIVPAGVSDMTAACGFAVALASRLARAAAEKVVVWITPDFHHLEYGGLYGPGFSAYGLDLSRLLLVRVATAEEALWALQTVLAYQASAVVVGEFLPEKLQEKLLVLCRRQQAAPGRDKPMLIFLGGDFLVGAKMEVSSLRRPPVAAEMRRPLPQDPAWGVRLLRLAAGGGRLTDVNPDLLHRLRFEPKKGYFRDALPVDHAPRTGLRRALGA